ncbi:MAG: sensor domain-containing diguanylate cyclase [Armatimonadetes bacterium]|nr:sensor domain-containing diguanylate cyclase [Armatimonadota bacterium]MCX7968780.1 sensor domain-containing diguanylate cyclase [Armatimonadota bacterium]MDW8144088.1 sensor domain-containing diguanylate cyclase [Armatimonadota bacterium]
MRIFVILSTLWLGFCGVCFWFILKAVQNLGLALLSSISLAILGFLTAILSLLSYRIFVTDEQQKRLESLQTEWQATQNALRQLLSQRDQLGLLVQLLHRFVIVTTRQDIALTLLRELPPFLHLDKMEIVVFDTTTVYGVWDGSSSQMSIEELESKDRDRIPSWAKEQPTRNIAQIHNSLLIPVVTDENIIALIRLERSSRISFTTDELRFLEAVANQTALALEKAKLIAFLENLSITDELTGIANRRHFEWRLSEEVERARRYQYPLSALMLDLDHFKQVNDTYGHQVGDIVLQQIAQRLRRVLRRTDFLARYGGEEFIVLAPQTPADRALILAERLRQVIAESPITVSSDLQIRITISVGVAVFPEHAQNGNELVRAADEALYKAKQTGRNKVCLFELEPAKGGENNVRA